MNRRGFLTAQQRARRELARSGSICSRKPARADGCGGPPPGVQLFTVREALGRDPRAALRSLREIGIVEAELYGLNGPENATLFGLPARELKRAFDENGIRVPTLAHRRRPREHGRDRATSRARSASRRVFVALPSEFSGTSTAGSRWCRPRAARNSMRSSRS